MLGKLRTLYNKHRKVEALQSAIKELEGLQVALIGVRRKFDIRLLQTANQWRDVLEHERIALQTQIEASG